MPALLADVNIERHTAVLVSMCETGALSDVWRYLDVTLHSFADFGLPRNADDAIVWRTCQTRDVFLLTANRNDDGPTSLESTIRTEGTITSLPVLTLADPDRVLADRNYARTVSERLIESILDADQLRGAGRIFLP